MLKEAAGYYHFARFLRADGQNRFNAIIYFAFQVSCKAKSAETVHTVRHGDKIFSRVVAEAYIASDLAILWDLSSSDFKVEGFLDIIIVFDEFFDGQVRVPFVFQKEGAGHIIRYSHSILNCLNSALKYCVDLFSVNEFVVPPLLSRKNFVSLL